MQEDDTPLGAGENQDQGVDLEQQEQALAEDMETRLDNFLQSVPSAHPNFSH